MPILNHTRVTASGQEPERWMLMLHGIYGSGRNWGTIARRLVERRPEWGVFLVDLRMHGASTGFSPPHTLAAAAQDIEELVQHLGIPVAAILGHSFGGKVSLLAAAGVPGLQQCWVVDSTLEVGEPGGTAWRMIETVRSLPPEFGSRQEAVEGIMAARFPEAIAQWMAINLEPADGVYRWRIDIDAMEEMLRDYFRVDVWEIAEHPPGETTIHVVKATESRSISDDAEARIEAAAGRGARVALHRLEGGHWINTDNPEGVLELLVANLG